MNLLQRFQQYINEHRLFTPQDTLLLAVSGGIDSVVLCELCKQAGYDFVIAHCNFKLRDEESERDAAFVKQLAVTYQVPVLIKDFDTRQYAAVHKLSIQEAARELRYRWFESEVGSQKSEVGSRKSEVGSKRYEEGETKDESEFQHSGGPTRNHKPETINCIVTAHHLDDNIETMLMHFFRGTGIHGLRGMLPKQGYIVRPLLFARKQELKQFADERGLNWVEDSSNALDKYTRNYFRHQVIPLVQKIYPEAENNLVNNLRRFADMELLYEQALEQHTRKLLEYRDQEVHIPVLKLQKLQPLHTIVYEIINRFGFSSAQTDEVIHLLNSESGKYVQSATHRIIRNRRWLIIAPQGTEQAQHVIIDAEDTNVPFATGSLHISQLAIDNMQLTNDRSVAFLDKKAIQFPLLLRRWKKGDYFYPLGMKKKKKLARFFIDQKLSLTDKEKVWVLESNKKIVWVIGWRIDDRFKITDSTQEVLRITLSEPG